MQTTRIHHPGSVSATAGLRPARGLITGAGISAILWAGIIAAVVQRLT